MAEPRARVSVGRVVFLQDLWLVQTLENHSANVSLLAAAWDGTLAFSGSIPDLGRTRARLVEAARIHDMGKPGRFRLVFAQDRGQRWRWEYSFAGHRFEASHDDQYVQMLAQLHHEYSVSAITQHMARLMLRGPDQRIAPNLPLDLYALEMCDQIEATIARAVLGSSDPEERVFMDFQFRTRRAGEYDIEPFAFAGAPLEFTIEYAELAPPPEKVHAVREAAIKGRQQPLLRDLQTWLGKQLQAAPLQCKEVRLWPWTE